MVRPFFVAALWSEAPDPSTGESADSFALVTGEANAMRAEDRMPAYLVDRRLELRMRHVEQEVS